jgi:hypothetical protein
MKKYPEYIEKDNSIDFVSNDHGENYNLYVIIFCDNFPMFWIYIDLLY